MADPRHDWYAAQWLKQLGKSQADVARDLDWNKARVSLMVRGIQPYDRDSVNELAYYLGIEPFELLLPFERAMSYRQYRASAEQILSLAHDSDALPADLDKIRRERKAEVKPSRKTGTHD